MYRERREEWLVMRKLLEIWDKEKEFFGRWRDVTGGVKYAMDGVKIRVDTERELLIEAVEWMQDLKDVWEDTRKSDDRVLLELEADINKIKKHIKMNPAERSGW
jgi:hypothetical protein